MTIFATLVLLGFFAREVRFVLVARNEGAHPLWTIIGSIQAAAFLVPLWLVWS